MTNSNTVASPLAALIAGLPRYDVIGYDVEMLPLVDGNIVYLSDVLVALEAIPATDARESLPTNCRKWDFYPIEMPLTKEGQGPAIPGKDEIASITYEVWDRLLNTHASFGNLPDAINEAMRLSRIALENK